MHRHLAFRMQPQLTTAAGSPARTLPCKPRISSSKPRSRCFNSANKPWVTRLRPHRSGCSPTYCCITDFDELANPPRAQELDAELCRWLAHRQERTNALGHACTGLPMPSFRERAVQLRTPLLHEREP